jgi:hypothetical protein
VFKHLAAILLLGILLFNWCGYQLFVAAIENRETHNFEVRIEENNYEASSLVCIKVPCTSLPYYSNSKSFERVQGSMEMNGIEYSFVKRRIYNDSIELLVIPDKAAMHLLCAKNDIFSLINDLQSSQTKKANSHHDKNKSFSLDSYVLTALSGLGAFYTPLLHGHLSYLENIPSHYGPTAEYPPDQAV